MPRAKQVFGGVCLQSFMPPDPDAPKPKKVMFKAEDYKPIVEPKKRKPRKRKDAVAQEPQPVVSNLQENITVSWN